MPACLADCSTRPIKMPATHELQWLTVRHDDVERLDRLAAIVDEVTASPDGLARALRNTPAYLNAIAADDARVSSSSSVGGPQPI
jgi:hypothetical protein